MSINPTGDETFGPDSFFGGMTVTVFHVTDDGTIKSTTADAVTMLPFLLATLFGETPDQRIARAEAEYHEFSHAPGECDCGI